MYGSELRKMSRIVLSLSSFFERTCYVLSHFHLFTSELLFSADEFFPHLPQQYIFHAIMHHCVTHRNEYDERINFSSVLVEKVM